MNLDELVTTVGPGPVRSHIIVNDGAAQVTDVVIYDSTWPLGPGQLVLAVGITPSSAEARDLVRDAGHDGVAAVIFRDVPEPLPPELGTAGVSVLLADEHVAWAQLLALLRTLISSAQDETPSAEEPSLSGGVHGLADVIAVMVGGSVVLYDRAHRVVAYSAQDADIDSVRRDTILGKRTPEQWIRRFTTDRSAYRTYQNPGEVVRLDNYPGLRTRLRIAVHAGGEILGEISVAEASRPLGPEAEIALKQAAKLAAPYLLRRRMAEDTEQTARWQLLRGLLNAEPEAARRATALGLDPTTGLTVIGISVQPREHPDLLAADVFNERLVHLLSLHMRTIDPAAGVLFAAPTYYAVVPIASETEQQRLPDRIKPALGQLDRLNIDARAAIGPRAHTLEQVPVSRRTADDVLLLLDRQGRGAVSATREDVWAELALLSAERAMASDGTSMGPQLRRLVRHDERHGTEYVKTLQVYLQEFGSTSAAADRLTVHPNTLRHRLERLTDISGVDLHDPTQRLAIALQLYALPHLRPA